MQDFFDPGNSQSDIFGRNSSSMKGVKSHLCGGLADSLSTYNPYHFTRMHFGHLELALNLA